MIKELLEDVIKDLDVKAYILKLQMHLAKAFRYLAVTIFSVFFYKEKKEKDDEEQLFI